MCGIVAAVISTVLSTVIAVVTRDHSMVDNIAVISR